jgi:hypothetical protein
MAQLGALRSRFRRGCCGGRVLAEFRGQRLCARMKDRRRSRDCCSGRLCVLQRRKQTRSDCLSIRGVCFAWGRRQVVASVFSADRVVENALGAAVSGGDVREASSMRGLFGDESNAGSIRSRYRRLSRESMTGPRHGVYRYGVCSCGG